MDRSVHVPTGGKSSGRQPLPSSMRQEFQRTAREHPALGKSSSGQPRDYPQWTRGILLDPLRGHETTEIRGTNGDSGRAGHTSCKMACTMYRYVWEHKHRRKCVADGIDSTYKIETWEPISADVIAPTCLATRDAFTLSVSCKVVMLPVVSLIFQMSMVKLYI